MLIKQMEMCVKGSRHYVKIMIEIWALLEVVTESMEVDEDLLGRGSP